MKQLQVDFSCTRAGETKSVDKAHNWNSFNFSNHSCSENLLFLKFKEDIDLFHFYKMFTEFYFWYMIVQFSLLPVIHICGSLQNMIWTIHLYFQTQLLKNYSKLRLSV